ncbi:endoglucanase precursor [bacterium BMS3Bbin02]|nr:endoglucanase precursor [bacterium BMS3Bbin02]
MRRVASLFSVSLALVVFASSAIAESGPDDLETPWDYSGDIQRTPEIPLSSDSIDPFAWDPLYLIGAEWVRENSIGTDVLEVWICEPGGVQLGATLTDTVSILSGGVGAYYDEISGGKYAIDFVEGGIVMVPDSNLCMPAVQEAAVSNPAVSSGAVVVVAGTGSGGYASILAGTCGGCGFPTNERIAVVGGGAVTQTSQGIPDMQTTTHEIGHMLQFPHSYTGVSDSEYDNPSDFMSGNVLPNGSISFFPYLTLAANRYAAGWIDPSDVLVVKTADDEQSLELVTYDRTGTKMVAFAPDPTVWISIETRQTRPWDPIPSEYEGVAVHIITQRPGSCNTTGYGWCFGVSRRQQQGVIAPRTTEHILGVGEYLEVGGFTLEVLERTSDGYSVAINAGVPRFTDVPGSHTFATAIEWMADRGITKGCNPSDGNTKFCPDAVVTRGQMAAFLVRALGLSASLDNPFTDDDDSVFEADIEKLAAAGITRGCNPAEGNTKFCPDGKVTREQMAAFLVRALGYIDDGGGDLFIDDDFSIFEGAIDRMATAGVTKGCNPPTNDRFCPTDYVTRGQMAAFLSRALGG